MYTFEGRTSSDIYEDMMDTLFNEGTRRDARGQGATEIRPVVIGLEHAAANKFIILPNRGINYAFAMAEIIWILSGRGDYEYIGGYNKSIGQFLDDKEGEIDIEGMTTEHNFHASYGRRVRRAQNQDGTAPVDQLQYVYDKISKDRNTRQAVITLWDYRLDTLIQAKDHPCNTMCMFKVEGDALDITVIRRSNDIIWGFPYNQVQFASIQEYMAGWLGLKCGHYYEYIDSLHVYDNLQPKQYNFFKKKVANAEPFVFDLSCIESGKPDTSHEAMDNYLNKMIELEKVWRKTIKDDMPLPQLNDLITESHRTIRATNVSRYWVNMFWFMFSYRLYSKGFVSQVEDIVLNDIIGLHFKLMAIETFKSMKTDLLVFVREQIEVNSDQEILKQFDYHYGDLTGDVYND